MSHKGKLWKAVCRKRGGGRGSRTRRHTHCRWMRLPQKSRRRSSYYDDDDDDDDDDDILDEVEEITHNQARKRGLLKTGITSRKLRKKGCLRHSRSSPLIRSRRRSRVRGGYGARVPHLSARACHPGGKAIGADGFIYKTGKTRHGHIRWFRLENEDGQQIYVTDHNKVPGRGSRYGSPNSRLTYDPDA